MTRSPQRGTSVKPSNTREHEEAAAAAGAAMAGKVVLVTGGSRGLGLAMATGFAAAGADVVVSSRNLEECVRVATTLEAAHGRRALPVACNVGDWSQCDALVETVYAEFGRVDVLVNNAGMSPLYPSLEGVGEALFDKVVGVNLKGPFRLSAAIGTRMAATGSGAIINMSSAEAASPSAVALPYAMAKAGLNAMTDGLAQAFAPNVRVNTIQCGPFLTDVAAHWTPAIHAEVAARVPLGRAGEPHEVVGAALYFASDDASFCTGATLRLDGGLH